MTTPSLQPAPSLPSSDATNDPTSNAANLTTTDVEGAIAHPDRAIEDGAAEDRPTEDGAAEDRATEDGAAHEERLAGAGWVARLEGLAERCKDQGRPVTKLIPLLFWIGMVGYVVIMPNFSLGTGSLCLFQILTGYDCPGCGMTRSSTAFAWGNFVQAVTYHPGGPIFVTWLTGLTLYKTTEFIRGRAFTPSEFLQRIYSRAFTITIITIFLYGVLRLGLELLGFTAPLRTLDIGVR